MSEGYKFGRMMFWGWILMALVFGGSMLVVKATAAQEPPEPDQNRQLLLRQVQALEGIEHQLSRLNRNLR